LLGRMMAPRGRIAVGVLAYIWAQAVLVQPAIAFMRVSHGRDDPALATVALGVLLIVVAIGAGRVQKSAFRLDSVGGGIFMVVVAGIVTSLVDLILSGS
jgi:hypothetical protein